MISLYSCLFIELLLLLLSMMMVVMLLPLLLQCLSAGHILLFLLLLPVCKCNADARRGISLSLSLSHSCSLFISWIAEMKCQMWRALSLRVCAELLHASRSEVNVRERVRVEYSWVSKQARRKSEYERRRILSRRVVSRLETHESVS